MNRVCIVVEKVVESHQQHASGGSILQGCKRAVSLLTLKKKKQIPHTMTVYLPLNTLKSNTDTQVPESSSNDELSIHSAGNSYDGDDTDFSPPSRLLSHVTFSQGEKSLIAEDNFEYLVKYFKHSLSNNVHRLNLEKSSTIFVNMLSSSSISL
jgi:hypothetical protein